MRNLFVMGLLAATMVQFCLKGLPQNARNAWHGGLACSPRGDYIAFLTVELPHPADQGLLLFVPHINREATLTVTDRLGKTVSQIQIPTFGGYGWTAKSELLVGCGTDGRDEEVRYWRILNARGHQVGQILPVPTVTSIRAWKLSPDGHYLAYVGVATDACVEDQLVVQRLNDQRILAQLPMSAYIDQLAWAPDSREVAVVGGEFIWLLSVADKQASTLRKTRRAEYYGGTIVLVPPLLVNVSHVGLGLMRVNGSQQTRHLAVGSVMKCSVAPKGTKVVGLLMPVKGGDKAATLCVGRLSMSGFHQLRQIRRGAIVDFCWDPSGRQVVYLTDTGKVETVAVW